MHSLVLEERRLPLEHLLAVAALELGLLVLPQVLAQVSRVRAALIAVRALVLLQRGDGARFNTSFRTYAKG